MSFVLSIVGYLATLKAKKIVFCLKNHAFCKHASKMHLFSNYVTWPVILIIAQHIYLFCEIETSFYKINVILSL